MTRVKAYGTAIETLIDLRDDDEKEAAIVAVRWSPAFGLMPFALRYISAEGSKAGIAALADVSRMFYEAILPEEFKNVRWVASIDNIRKIDRIPDDLQSSVQVELELDNYDPYEKEPMPGDCTCIAEKKAVN